MNRSKVKIGEEYACRFSKYGVIMRVRVLEEVDVVFRPYSPPSPGFLVEVTETPNGGYADGSRIKVGTRHLLMTWNDHLAEAAAEVVREERRRVELCELRAAELLERQEAEQRLHTLLAGRGRASLRLLDDLDVKGHKVYSFSITELADLIAEVAR